MIKLVVSDFDGTILPYTESAVSGKTIELIENMIDSGIVFAVSSGRTYRELVSFFPEFKDSIYFICCDGAITVKEEKTVYSRKIEMQDLELFFKKGKENFSFVLHGADKNYCYGSIPAEAERYDCIKIDSIYRIKERIYKITSYGEPVELPEYCGIRSHWDGGRFKAAQYVNRFSNKGTALSDLQTRLMLTKYDTAILGDKGNDVSMVRNAKISCCIGDSCEELSAMCTDRFGTADEAFEHILSCYGK